MRRLAYSAPFVVIVACDRPPPITPIAQPAPAPVDAAVAAVRPAELVDALQPLTPFRTIDQFCGQPKVHCNPPRPGTEPPPKPEPVQAMRVRIRAMKREPAGTRVRFVHGYRMDPEWRAAFVTHDGVELPGGECVIVAWDYQELECTTELTPEQIADGRKARELRVVPPAALVARVEREREQWGRPPPPPPQPVLANLVQVAIQGIDTIVTVDRGSDHGVDKHWTAVLVDDRDRPLVNGACLVIRVDKSKTVCRLKLASERIKRRMLLRPPPPR